MPCVDPIRSRILGAAPFAMKLDELPPPPPDREGWPWTVADDDSNAFHDTESVLPKISIITPSFNQTTYLEETIRSVLLQGYPNLEYIIIDGASTDGSVDIIHKYSRWISYWCSKEDNGQSDAINQGFRIAGGDIVNWLCSDDLLRPGALWKVALLLADDTALDVLAGACRLQYDNEHGRVVDTAVAGPEWERHPYSDGIWQPSCFYRRSAVDRNFLVDEDIHYCMDRELWCHFVKHRKNWHRSDEVLSHYRYTGANKSMIGSEAIIDEIVTIFHRYTKCCFFLPEILRDIWLPLVLRGMRPDLGPKRIASALAARAVAAGLLGIYPQRHVRNLQREIYSYSVW